MQNGYPTPNKKQVYDQEARKFATVKYILKFVTTNHSAHCIVSVDMLLNVAPRSNKGCFLHALKSHKKPQEDAKATKR